MERIDCASFSELEDMGIAKTINHGRNSSGFNERTIVLNDGSKWDYIPEDNQYERQQINPVQSDGLRYVNSHIGYVDQDEEYY